MSEKKLVALYQGKYSENVWLVDSWVEDADDYVRTSDIVEVEFTPRPHKDIVLERVRALDAEIKSVRATMVAKINNLEDQKARLLAIEDKSE